MQDRAKLCIKNVTTGQSDETLDVNVDSTIAELKILIQDTYPGNPRADQQRLIFFGRAPADTETLRQISATGQYSGTDPITCHLVIRQSQPAAEQTAAP